MLGKEKLTKEIDELPKDAKDFRDTRAMLETARDVADSMHSTTQINKLYRMIIVEKTNALILDEEGYAFFQFKLDIKPKGLIYAVCFTELTLMILSKEDPQTFDQPLGILRKKFERLFLDNKALV